MKIKKFKKHQKIANGTKKKRELEKHKNLQKEASFFLPKPSKWGFQLKKFFYLKKKELWTGSESLIRECDIETE